MYAWVHVRMSRVLYSYLSVLYIENVLSQRIANLFSSRVTPHLAARHESNLYQFVFFVYRAIQNNTRVHSVAMEDRVSWTTLGRERNISCELTAKKLPRHFLCVLRSRARTIRTHCVRIAIVAEGLRFESCDQNKRNREEIETRVCELVDIVCNG